MSKGSTPRPMAIDREQFGNRFDAIFGKPKEAAKPLESSLDRIRRDKEKNDDEQFKRLQRHYFGETAG